MLKTSSVEMDLEEGSGVGAIQRQSRGTGKQKLLDGSGETVRSGEWIRRLRQSSGEGELRLRDTLPWAW